VVEPASTAALAALGGPVAPLRRLQNIEGFGDFVRVLSFETISTSSRERWPGGVANGTVIFRVADHRSVATAGRLDQPQSDGGTRPCNLRETFAATVLETTEQAELAPRSLVDAQQ